MDAATLRTPLFFFDLFLLAATAWLVASLAGILAAAALAPGEARALISLLREDPSPPEAAAATLDPGATARLFGVDLSPPVTEPQGEPAPSPLRASVLATLVANRAPWSFATLRDELTGAVDVVQPGERFLDATLEAVEPLRVILLRDGRREFLSVGAAGRPPPIGPTQIDDDGPGVSRASVDRQLARLTQLANDARIVPSFRGGKAVGFKLFAIRKGSLYEQVGLRNGDVILAIDGYALDTPDRALEVYGKLNGASRFELQLERRGQPLTKTIELR